MKFKARGAAKTLSLSLDAASTATSTWPPKGRARDGPRGAAQAVVGVSPAGGRSPEDAGRPRTATLDKPLVLDIALLGVLDMTTLTRRGLLDVCRLRSSSKAVLGGTACTATPRQSRQASRASSRSDVSGDELTPVATRRRAGNALVRQKKTVIEEEDDEESSWADEDPAGRYGTYRVRRNNRLNRTFRIPALKRQPLANILNNNNINDNEAGGMDLKGGARGRRAASGPSLEDILAASSREQVPEPCRACGRPELPERLHSHPRQPGKPHPHGHPGYGPLPPPQARGPAAPEPPVKNSVRKPVPIKYRPRRGSETANNLEAPTAARTRSPAKGPNLATHFLDADGPGSPARTARGPRLVVCYVCGREFGTASLALHEPQCVQRWQLQNSKLSPQWQRQLPDKPTGPIRIEDWNKFAAESAKRADSVQCPNCLRRFCPDRINSHERMCFKKQVAVAGEPQTQPDSLASAHGRGSPLVECRLCGKKFGTRSINIHEPQCLKKWQQLHAESGLPGSHGGANISLDKSRDCPQIEGPPEGKQTKPLAIEFPHPSRPPAPPTPTAPAPSLGPGTTAKDRLLQATAAQPKAKSAWAGEAGVALVPASAPTAVPAPAPPAPTSTPSARKATPKTAASGRGRPGRPLRCYLCGQMFGLQSLPIHEPQCLQKWRLENAKLPPHLQRAEPERPEIIFTGAGEIDCDATAEAAWQAHLSQLIPCSHCSRKFSPERIGVHERCCKGGDK